MRAVAEGRNVVPLQFNLRAVDESHVAIVVDETGYKLLLHVLSHASETYPNGEIRDLSRMCASIIAGTLAD